VNQFIKLNNQTEIDLPKLIESKLLVQANSGGGKSWALRRILEQSHGKVQHIILDSEGEFATLREKYDYVLAGKGGDTPAEPRSAALLARKLLELKVSAIIDLYELHPQERKRFVRLFLESLITHRRISGTTALWSSMRPIPTPPRKDRAKRWMR
jgi:DNA helicase HerA-like ATPase